jgi:hypothetical protein
MFPNRTLIPAAALFLIAGIGSLATRNSNGFENILSNIFWFALVASVLFFIAVAARTLIASTRARHATRNRI